MKIFRETVRVLLILMVLFCFTGATSGICKEVKKAKKKPSQAIRISSDKMEAYDQKGTVVFTGNVVAKKGNLTIYADRLEVFYDQQKTADNKKKRRLKKIVFMGHLKIVQGRRKATAKEAIYYKPQEKIVLLKNAQVWDGPNTIKGDKIVLYVNESRSVVESSGKDRVEAVVFSEGD
ncbi:MAG: lipopolysaccharide transport periplasmic protein LptA [Thermodesulfobacteria bacterium]|nr:lipopolysaccharide transport periplasmic protein LptA [Thermodesulfobacteriota bacterium]